ncbi:unnamed protein product [Spirodela intermedia]|uniref:Uncharacterized protein n=1 Tax=Spirodela intermedia TaxID=51605 RepID=A0A7I8JG10_SPIIN|nr:unnamed protein product [Spirodela intermedia]CAA6669108.1 unnamed protein product [Spirodela intermedia]
MSPGAVAAVGAKGGKNKGSSWPSKLGTLKDTVTVSYDKSKITISSEGPSPSGNDLRVIASNNDRNLYELCYFNMVENEGEERRKINSPHSSRILGVF